MKLPVTLAVVLGLTMGALTAHGSVSFQLRMNLQPIPSDQGYDYEDPYYYDQRTPEGFVIGPDDWWIGEEPYLPYYGYNPPTTQGYYPPYLGTYGRGFIYPAPPLARAPVEIPTLRATPIPPPPLRYRWTPDGIEVERDPHFHLFRPPRYPDFLTSGSVIYQEPPDVIYPYPYWYPPPYPYPY